MTRAAIIPFFKYEPSDPRNVDLLFRVFLLHAKKWAKFVNTIYVIDSGCNLELPFSAPIGLDNIKIIHVPPQSHWQNMNEAIRNAPEESFVLLDSDMLIYNPDAIAAYFALLVQADAVSILDTSGGTDLSKTYPQMAENNLRGERRRLCPYLCFIKKSALRSDFDFTPRGGDNWTDSMGKITEQLLEDQKSIYEIQDDRSTISLEDDGRITSVQWLDTPPKEWALVENPNLGYYHIRNFGGALLLVNAKYHNKETYYKCLDVMPLREVGRLLAWIYVLTEKVGDPVDYIHPIIDDIHARSIWDEYIERFKNYHHWIKNI